MASEATARFNTERLDNIIDCLDLQRRLSGRILGHGVQPEKRLTEAMIDLRDLLEELSFREPLDPPTQHCLQKIHLTRQLVISTPPPTFVGSGEQLSGAQKILLGDFMVFLERGRGLLEARRDPGLMLPTAHQFFGALLTGLVILLSDFLDQELFEEYDLPELIDSLTQALPEPEAPRKHPPRQPLVAETSEEGQALARALDMDDGLEAGFDAALQLAQPAESEAARALKSDLASDLEIDRAFDELFSGGGAESDRAAEVAPGGARPRGAMDYSREIDAIHSKEVRQLFASIARQFCQPLPSLLSNLQTKDLAPEHLEGIYGITLNIHNSAEQFGYEELRQAIAPLRKLLEGCQCNPERLNAKEQLQILAEYDRLCVDFPDVFEPIERTERGRLLKESIIIMEQLRAIKGMGTRRITKLFAAGISDLRAFCCARLEDFAAVSSIDRDLAERILMAFKPYEVLVATVLGDNDLLQRFYVSQREHLRREVAHLRYTHELYHAESKKPRFRSRRHHLRELHRQRELVMGSIRVALAVLDEVKLVEEMRGTRYERRLEMLEAYLASTGLEPISAESARALFEDQEQDRDTADIESPREE